MYNIRNYFHVVRYMLQGYKFNLRSALINTGLYVINNYIKYYSK